MDPNNNYDEHDTTSPTKFNVKVSKDITVACYNLRLLKMRLFGSKRVHKSNEHRNILQNTRLLPEKLAQRESHILACDNNLIKS